jgi:hypothetical protein
MTDQVSEEGTSHTYRVDITVYIEAPSQDRVNEIVDILESKLMEVPSIHRFDVED